jgi:uncharacterized membrane protein YtjA (UPF0391 family)
VRIGGDPWKKDAIEKPNPPLAKEIVMLYWAAVFFIVALIAAVLGFGGIAAGAAGIAKILFFIFLVAFVVSLLMGVFRRGV